MIITADFIIKNRLSPIVTRVDGVVIPHAIALDTEAGKVQHYICDEDGNVTKETRVITGEITFEYIDELIEQKLGHWKPRTYGCHHSHLTTCDLCDHSVRRWRLEHRGELEL